jgi:hypothetical protein
LARAKKRSVCCALCVASPGCSQRPRPASTRLPRLQRWCAVQAVAVLLLAASVFRGHTEHCTVVLMCAPTHPCSLTRRWKRARSSGKCGPTFSQSPEAQVSLCDACIAHCRLHVRRHCCCFKPACWCTAHMLRLFVFDHSATHRSMTRPPTTACPPRSDDPRRHHWTVWL